MMTRDPEPALLTIEEAARYLRLSRAKVYSMAARGELPAVKMGRSVRIRRERLDAWLDAPVFPLIVHAPSGIGRPMTTREIPAARPDRTTRRCKRCGRIGQTWRDGGYRLNYDEVAPTLIDLTLVDLAFEQQPLELVDVTLHDPAGQPYTISVTQRYVAQFRCRDHRTCLVDGVPARPVRLPWVGGR